MNEKVDKNLSCFFIINKVMKERQKTAFYIVERSKKQAKQPFHRQPLIAKSKL
jgi:hypothetical protein